jgi:hypothetical protein
MGKQRLERANAKGLLTVTAREVETCESEDSAIPGNQLVDNTSVDRPRSRVIFRGE